MRSKKSLHAVIIAIGSLVFMTNAWASSVAPGDLFFYDPMKVLMVDGKDPKADVNLRVWLDTPDRGAFDFGFMNNGVYTPFINKGFTQGKFSFSGGTIVDFALRNKGSDGLFGTQDDSIYRLSDGLGYVSQNYFGLVNPTNPHNAGVTQNYYQNLTLLWDLNLDGTPDAHTLLELTGSRFDGMMPSALAVPLPSAAWLLGSGILGFAAALRRRRPKS